MIQKPYTLTERNIQTLATQTPVTGDDWDKQVYKTIKKNIKTYYCIQQKRYCAYCQTELEDECHSEHIEHIVDKGTYPQWMFEPYNLALSCSQCNTKKATKSVLAIFSMSAVVLPKGSLYSTIAHPHFDDWNKNIDIFDDVFVKSKTPKGATTIEICELWRPLYADRRARAQSINRQDRIFYALFHIQEHNVPAQEIDQFMDYIDRISQIL